MTNAPTQKSAQTVNVSTHVLPQIPVPRMQNATRPITNQHVDVPLDWREIPTSSVSVLSVESTQTVQQILPAYQTDASTLAYTKTHVLPRQHAQ